MRPRYIQRAWLRGVLAAGAALRRPIVVDGKAMDPMMSAFVRFVRAMRGDPGGLPGLRRRYATAPGVTGLLPDRTVRATSFNAAAMRMRRYEPPWPSRATMLYFHGGGFIMGSLDTHDGLCRRLAARAGLQIVSVEYPLAPEHPFPAAHDDAARAWAWVAANVPGKLLVGGDSAGANLAAGLALSGQPALQVLIYPAVDMQHVDGLYPSIERYGDGFLLTKEGMRECARLLIPPKQDPADIRLSPIHADLSRASAGGHHRGRVRPACSIRARLTPGHCIRRGSPPMCWTRPGWCTDTPISPAWCRKRGARSTGLPMRSGQSWTGAGVDAAATRSGVDRMGFGAGPGRPRLRRRAQPLLFRLLDTFHVLMWRLGEFIADLSSMALDVVRALAIGLYATFVVLAFAVLRRGGRARAALIVVTLLFLVLVAHDDMVTESNGRWMAALALSAVGAIVMTTRLRQTALVPRPY